LVANDATEMLTVVKGVWTVEKIVVVGAAVGRDATPDVMIDVIVHGNDVNMT